MLFQLALIATLLAGHPPRLPQKPWHLMVAIEETSGTTWLTSDYGSREECEEDMNLLALTPPVRGRIVDAYCEREPFTV